MIVWGGSSSSALLDLNDGGRYDPLSDSWRPMSVVNAPASRHGFSTAWTGRELIVWGGISGSAVNTGGRYDPLTDTWTVVSANGAPSPRYSHSAIWTGREMIVWGGFVRNLGNL
ncbi:MAG: galactose oxidase, partial [Verrucomicrobia bacterium]